MQNLKDVGTDEALQDTPVRVGKIAELESMQRSFTAHGDIVKDLNYREPLKTLRLYFLECRWEKCIIIYSKDPGRHDSQYTLKKYFHIGMTDINDCNLITPMKFSDSDVATMDLYRCSMNALTI